MLSCRTCLIVVMHQTLLIITWQDWPTLLTGLPSAIIDVKRIDEQLIQQFLDDHLPRCNCEKPAFHDSALKPDHIRQFVASQRVLCSVPASMSAPISALRGYFRYRATLGVFRPARNIARFRMF